MNIAITNGAKGEYERSLEGFKKATAIFQEIGHHPALGVVSLKKARTLIGQTRWSEAIQELLIAINYFPESELLHAKSEAHQLLAESYEVTGQINEALQHYKIFNQLEAQIFSDDVRRKIISYPLQYQLLQNKRRNEGNRDRSRELQRRVDNSKKELATISMRIAQVSDLLDELRGRLIKLHDVDEQTRQTIKSVIQRIEDRSTSVKAWNTLEERLQNFDQEFAGNLLKAYPSLTPAEVRICSLLRMNMSNKEIAALLNNSSRTITTHRTRIRKKLQLKTEESLVATLLTV